jgi:hypothetical protein
MKPTVWFIGEIVFVLATVVYERPEKVYWPLNRQVATLA